MAEGQPAPGLQRDLELDRGRRRPARRRPSIWDSSIAWLRCSSAIPPPRSMVSTSARAVRLADHRRRLCVLPVAREVAGDRARAGRVRPVGSRRKGSTMTGNFAAGEKVLLLDSKKRRYLIDLVDDGEFHSHAGFVTHASIIGQREGVVVRSTKGSEYTALRPTLEDFVVEMPRGAQVIYPKDLGPICILADIGPGVRVFESGIGSGALSMTMLRYGAEIVGYEIREDFANRARKNVESFLGPAALDRYDDPHRRQLRGHRPGTRPVRPRRARHPRAVAGRAARRGGAVAPVGCSSRTRRRSPRPRRCASRSRASGSTPAPSRCSTVAGTSRGRPCDPTTGWSPTPASSASPGSSAATRPERAPPTPLRRRDGAAVPCRGRRAGPACRATGRRMGVAQVDDPVDPGVDLGGDEVRIAIVVEQGEDRGDVVDEQLERARDRRPTARRRGRACWRTARGTARDGRWRTARMPDHGRRTRGTGHPTRVGRRRGRRGSWPSSTRSPPAAT